MMADARDQEYDKEELPMLSIGVFAFNEEEKLPPTVEIAIAAAKLAGDIPFELIIVNDGSTDQTGMVAAGLKEKHEEIRLINHPTNMGIGSSIQDIIKAARGDKICFVPGDNIFTPYTVRQLLLNAYKADVVLHYHINSEVRTKTRVVLSLIFNLIYKFVFNLRIIYVNCLGIYPTSMLKEMKIRSKRYSIPSELNVKALLSGHTYYEIGSYMNKEASKSSAMSFLNFMEVCFSFVRLIWEVKIANRSLYSKTPARIIDSL